MSDDAAQIYRGHGVEFRYPGWWDLSEQAGDHDVSITVAGPGTSFWSLGLFFDQPAPERLIESAVDAFRSEYPELDVYPATARLCGLETAARDLDFVCLELINSASLRSFRCERFTAFVLYQGNDRELEETRDILEAISASLKVEVAEEDAEWL